MIGIFSLTFPLSGQKTMLNPAGCNLHENRQDQLGLLCGKLLGGPPSCCLVCGSPKKPLHVMNLLMEYVKEDARWTAHKKTYTDKARPGPKKIMYRIGFLFSSLVWSLYRTRWCCDSIGKVSESIAPLPRSPHRTKRGVWECLTGVRALSIGGNRAFPIEFLVNIYIYSSLVERI